MQLSIVLGVKACLTARKVGWQGGGMLWYGYTHHWSFQMLRGMMVELVKFEI